MYLGIKNANYYIILNDIPFSFVVNGNVLNFFVCQTLYEIFNLNDKHGFMLIVLRKIIRH